MKKNSFVISCFVVLSLMFSVGHALSDSLDRVGRSDVENKIIYGWDGLNYVKDAIELMPNDREVSTIFDSSVDEDEMIIDMRVVKTIYDGKINGVRIDFTVDNPNIIIGYFDSSFEVVVDKYSGLFDDYFRLLSGNFSVWDVYDGEYVGDDYCVLWTRSVGSEIVLAALLVDSRMSRKKRIKCVSEKFLRLFGVFGADVEHESIFSSKYNYVPTELDIEIANMVGKYFRSNK